MLLPDLLLAWPSLPLGPKFWLMEMFCCDWPWGYIPDISEERWFNLLGECTLN